MMNYYDMNQFQMDHLVMFVSGTIVSPIHRSIDSFPFVVDYDLWISFRLRLVLRVAAAVVVDVDVVHQSSSLYLLLSSLMLIFVLFVAVDAAAVESPSLVAVDGYDFA